jgi:hypothetical protein
MRKNYISYIKILTPLINAKMEYIGKIMIIILILIK